MINYSLTKRQNRMDPTENPKVYATAQITDVLTIEDFAEHISEHHSKYGKGDIYCILTEMVTCMREQLLLGNKIQLGDMGSFYPTLKCKGSKTFADFDTATNIKKVNVNWTRGKNFTNLIDDATFSQVVTRKAQAAAVKAVRATVITPGSVSSSSSSSSTGSNNNDDDDSSNATND